MKNKERIAEKRVLLVGFLVFLMLLCACGSDFTFEPQGERTIGEQKVQVEKLQFSSGKFKLVGDLLSPAEGERHPAIIMVHGSGNATRRGTVPFTPLFEIFLRNGYAVLSWDKPGSGASTGVFDGEHKLTQRAAILSDGIKVLAEHPAIDATRIGLWGISQAGWVMPLALDLSDDVAFMIVVSGGAEDSIEQMAYQVGQRVICDGGSAEQAALVERYWSQHAKATSYAEYREAMEVLVEIPQLQAHYTLEIAGEEEWKPWPQDINAFFDPMDVIKHITIPVLAIFGELDKNIDPCQGAAAYTAALQAAGNQDYQIEIIPDVSHVLMPAKTGCIGESGGRKYAPEYLQLLESWLQQLSQS